MNRRKLQVGESALKNVSTIVGGQTCYFCNGGGSCHVCGGTGINQSQACGNCGGSGRCNHCGGTGVYMIKGQCVEALESELISK
jgi:hypothetical protein